MLDLDLGPLGLFLSSFGLFYGPLDLGLVKVDRLHICKNIVPQLQAVK